jgi:riboflavin kinase/FMN adenylyltransferase
VVDPVTVPLLDLSIVPVSSSLIRWLLSHGRVRDAAICLGRPYQLVGTVVRGYQRGRTIGTPTVNLDCADQHIPADGVYAGRCTLAGRTYPAAVSIGNSPTFENTKWQLEAHLIGFTGDLYGQTLHLDLIDWLREQRRYPNLDLLKEQIARDITTCWQSSSINPATPIVAMSL